MRKGIMGGTFNPVHIGHLILAERAREEFSLDEVIFMPSHQPAYKNASEIMPDGVRLKMLRLAVQNHPHFAVSELELQRSGNTYTADTLLELEAAFPQHEFSFILGGDSVMSLEKWHHSEIIFSKAHILAAARPGYELERITAKAEELIQCYGADIQIFSVPQIEISSTEIRSRMKAGKSIRYLVPEAVETELKQYINL